MKRAKANASSARRKSLTDWDWTTLVASWRYYEYRMTITSSMFPGEVVQRFFSGGYTDESCRRIAQQFVEVDHRRGEGDWRGNDDLMDCDRSSWCKFYAFLKGYLYGFTDVVMDGTDKTTGEHLHKETRCFYCERTGRYYPVDSYIGNPEVEKYCAPEFIRKTSKSVNEGGENGK